MNSLMVTSNTNLPMVELTWSIPYTQIPPDSYRLTHTATKLSGMPLAEGDGVTMIEIMDNQADVFDDDSRSYSISDLLFYSHYQFELIAVYGDDNSTSTSVNVTMTAEGSEFMCAVM